MATTGPTSLPAFFSTDADFRTWAAGVHTALAAVGLTNTADTGQINTATVLKPAANNTAQGYEIWRFSDALQATLPIFLKVEYGSGGTVDRPSLWVTVGSTTNGAGSLGGQLSSRIQVPAGSSKTAGVTLPLYASGASDRIHMGCNLDFTASNFGIVWAVERTKDPTGANTADGYVLVAPGGSASGTQGAAQAMPASGSPNAWACGPCLPTNSVGKSVIGADVAVSPSVYFLGKPFFALLLAVLSADIGGASTFTVTVLGASHTYLSLGGGSDPAIIYASAFSSRWSGYAAAILWE